MLNKLLNIVINKKNIIYNCINGQLVFKKKVNGIER